MQRVSEQIILLKISPRVCGNTGPCSPLQEASFSGTKVT